MPFSPMTLRTTSRRAGHRKVRHQLEGFALDAQPRANSVWETGCLSQHAARILVALRCTTLWQQPRAHYDQEMCGYNRQLGVWYPLIRGNLWASLPSTTLFSREYSMWCEGRRNARPHGGPTLPVGSRRGDPRNTSRIPGRRVGGVRS